MEISSGEKPSRILIVCDSTKDRSIHEFSKTIRQIRMCGGIVHPGDTIRVFGVLHKVLHPSKSVVCNFQLSVLQYFYVELFKWLVCYEGCYMKGFDLNV